MYKYKFLQVGTPFEHAPVASVTEDIKIYQCPMIKRQWRCYPQWRGAYQLLSQSCFYCPNLITVAPL